MLDVAERQQILRLLVKEILVGAEEGREGTRVGALEVRSEQEPSYLLRSRSIRALTCEAHQAV